MSSLFDHLESFNDHIAFHQFQNEDVSYSELLKISNKISACLLSRETIALECSNSKEAIACYVACIRSKIVPILLEDNVEQAKLCSYAKLYSTRYIFCQKESTPSGYKKILEIGQFSLYEKSSLSLQNDIHDDLALLITTSGSTGSPKLVKLSYENLLSNTQSIIKYLAIDSNDLPITSLPMNYTFGLSILNTHLYAGSSIVLTNASVLEKSFWNAFERFKPTSLSGVPYTFQMLERLNFFSQEISCITKITQAGGKLSEDLALSIGQKCLEKNIDFYIMYGQSEATARMSYLPPNFLLSKPDSVGIAIPDGMFWLEDDDGNRVIDVNATGNLVYSGSNVSMGYAKSWRDLFSGDQNMKILYTGDLARIDDEGFIYIAGRQKRFIKIFGNRVNLDDIENFLSKNQLISAAAGSDDHLQIHIEDNGIDFEIADIKKLVSRFLKVHPSSIKINIVSKLPRNKSGKIQYKELN